jgi:hypothetical protein
MNFACACHYGIHKMYTRVIQHPSNLFYDQKLHVYNEIVLTLQTLLLAIQTWFNYTNERMTWWLVGQWVVQIMVVWHWVYDSGRFLSNCKSNSWEKKESK